MVVVRPSTFVFIASKRDLMVVISRVRRSMRVESETKAVEYEGGASFAAGMIDPGGEECLEFLEPGMRAEED